MLKTDFKKLFRVFGRTPAPPWLRKHMEAERERHQILNDIQLCTGATKVQMEMLIEVQKEHPFSFATLRDKLAAGALTLDCLLEGRTRWQR